MSGDETATTRATGIRVAAVVYNPIKVDLDAIKAAMKAEQEAAGWGESLWFETTEEDPGAGVTEKALAEGVSMIVVAGGDGTVRAVAEAAQGHDVAVALVPSGTGNLLARNLELELDDLEGSIHSAFSGEDRKIDVGVIEIRRADSRIDKHAYVVMAGFGLDANMLANTDEELKAKIGWLAYLKALSLALRDTDMLQLRYSLDSRGTKSGHAHTVIVGNCGTLQGGIQMLPDAAVDDGRLDIAFMRPQNLFTWAQTLVKIFWENGVLRRTRVGRSLRTEVNALSYDKGERFTVKLSRPEKIELDGDEFGETVAIRTWVEAGALTIRMPAEPAG
jgi:diacylglycerol kinase family enzyme